ncbi:hypothetical protein ACFCX0_34275 [Streptomyces sp. NPDC056352]|uniref:alpha/beta fold hydrolase n=1 Tax=Streptomyces sp. NPDC056352 TaxID=3345791 RepID=UPI0035D86C73
MEFRTKSGTTLVYDDRGPSGGLPVVLIHGHPFDRTMWAPQAEALERAGYRVTARGGREVPVLLVFGADDTYTPVADGEALHRLIPHSALVVVDRAAHLPNLEQPERFNAALLGFLGGL